MDKQEQLIRKAFPPEQTQQILAFRETDRDFFELLVRKLVRMEIMLKTGNVKGFEKMKRQEEENFACLLSELTLKVGT